MNLKRVTLNRLQTAHKKLPKRIKKAAVDRDNGYNQKMGISAGKPVAVSNGHVSTTYMPMKKVEGASLEQELYKGKGILGNKSYIPTHTLLSHAKAAINEANNNGINHNDTQPGNILVTKKGAKLIDYGYAFKIMGAFPDYLLIVRLRIVQVTAIDLEIIRCCMIV